MSLIAPHRTAWRPVSAGEFAAALAPWAPFGTPPKLAVAVSGGADSTALALLANDWVRAEGGSLTALIVDHGLRRESAEEALSVRNRLHALGISAVILGDHAAFLAAGKQSEEAARRFRYDRLFAWCRAAGIRHLLVGHHRRDQAETVLMRLLHGSGLAGLAGMAACVDRGDLRLLRPLLAIDPARLRATLLARGVAWVEDPTNASPAYERSRLRRHAAALATAGLNEATLLALARTAQALREAESDRLTPLIARVCHVSPLGAVHLDPRLLSCDIDDTAAILQRVIATVGGRARPPALADCRRLAACLPRLPRQGAITLGGCVVRRAAAAFCVYREARNLPPPLRFLPPGGAEGEARCWDGRFLLRWRLPGAPSWPLELRALGAAGVGQWRAQGLPVAATELPAAALFSLPGLFCGDELVAAPVASDGSEAGGAEALTLAFRPAFGLFGHGYFFSSLSSIII
jgi:tRNA(Ile)-lysidine synthase